MIQNHEARRYFGLSEDVERRLQDHNEGKSKYTSKYSPWILKWISIPMNLSDARKLENMLKKQKGGIGLEPLLNQYKGS